MFNSSPNYAQIQRKTALVSCNAFWENSSSTNEDKWTWPILVHSEGQEDTFHYFGSKRKMQK
jgi:hypothetical protein